MLGASIENKIQGQSRMAAERRNGDSSFARRWRSRCPRFGALAVVLGHGRRGPGSGSHRHEEFAISVDLNNAWRANGVILPDLATDCLQNLLKFASRTADRGYEKVCALARAARPTQLSADLHAAVSLYLPVVASILFHVRAPNCR